MQAMECGAICHCLFKMIFRKFRVGLIGLRWRNESNCEMISYSVDRVQEGAIRGWTGSDLCRNDKTSTWFFADARVVRPGIDIWSALIAFSTQHKVENKSHFLNNHFLPFARRPNWNYYYLVTHTHCQPTPCHATSASANTNKMLLRLGGNFSSHKLTVYSAAKKKLCSKRENEIVHRDATDEYEIDLHCQHTHTHTQIQNTQ